MKFSPQGHCDAAIGTSPTLKWEKWDGLWLTLPRPTGLIYFNPSEQKQSANGRKPVIGSDRNAFALECPRAGSLSQRTKNVEEF
jgi:hypothetical protein